MSKDTHTHRGHCQYCLRVLAIDVTTGKLAKHGYTVKGGMFLGQCPGSDILSLHVDRTHTNRVIVMYQESAKDHTKRADRLEAGKLHPYQAALGSCYYEGNVTDEQLVKGWRFEYETVKIPSIDRTTGKHNGKFTDKQQAKHVAYDAANALQKRRALMLEIREERHNAEKAASFAESMTQWAKEVHDDKMPAYRVEDLDNWAKVGDTVRAGGEKNGFDAKVEAVEMRPYTTRGWLRGGDNTVITQHVRITRPAIADTYHKNGSIKKKGREAWTYWDAVRNVRPAKGSLIDRLKADDLL